MTQADVYVFTGSRDRRLETYSSVVDGLSRWCDQAKGSNAAVFVGDCPTGVDAIVRKHCAGYDNLQVFVAGWDRHGKGAGPRRNATMMDVANREYQNPLVIATLCGVSRGTQNAIEEAQVRGIRVLRRHVQEEKLSP